MLIKPPSGRHPFYSPDYIEFALAEFENKDWTNKTFKDLTDEFRDTFLSVPYFPVVLGKGSIVYRGRKKGFFKEGPFDRLDEIGIKPAEKVTTFGRANIPYQAIFYCCTKPETTAREVAQWYINDAGRFQDIITRGIIGTGFNPFTQLFTMGSWEALEDIVLASVLFNEKAIANNPAFQEFDQQRKLTGKNQDENVLKSANMVLDFFCKQFGKLDVRVAEEYKYSAYYANEMYNLRNRDLRFDGVIYSSVANDFDGENIALTENAYKTKLKFVAGDFCYSANLNYHPTQDGRRTVIGPIQKAELQADGSFKWSEVGAHLRNNEELP